MIRKPCACNAQLQPHDPIEGVCPIVTYRGMPLEQWDRYGVQSQHIDWCTSTGPFGAPDCDCPGSAMDKAYEALA